jgi:hypothetical protein
MANAKTTIHFQLQPNPKIITMKNAIKFFAALAIITLALSSCSSTKGTAYQSHLKNKKNGCMLSDFGCGWTNGKR